LIAIDKVIHSKVAAMYFVKEKVVELKKILRKATVYNSGDNF